MLWGRKGESGKKRESGVNLGGGGIAAALYFWTLSQHIPPKWVVHPGYLLTFVLLSFSNKYNYITIGSKSVLYVDYLLAWYPSIMSPKTLASFSVLP